jgi:hypothetical protein
LEVAQLREDPSELGEPHVAEAGEAVAGIRQPPQRLDDRLIGQPSAELEGASLENFGALAASPAQEGGCKPRLADSGFTFEHDDLASLTAKASKDPDERGVLGRPTNKRRLWPTPISGTGSRTTALLSRRRASRLDALPEIEGFWRWRGLDLRREDRSTRLKGPKRRGSIAAREVKPHQGAMGQLVERVAGDPAGRHVDRNWKIPLLSVKARQTIEDQPRTAMPDFPLASHPVVEVHGIAEREAFEKVTAISVRRRQ